METLTREQIVCYLKARNPRARGDVIHLYADCLLEYEKAQQNIDEYGLIVQHPRTGAPIDNPCIKLRNNAANKMNKAKLNVGILWEAMKDPALLEVSNKDDDGETDG